MIKGSNLYYIKEWKERREAGREGGSSEVKQQAEFIWCM
jgi:hypothetical protein